MRSTQPCAASIQRPGGGSGKPTKSAGTVTYAAAAAAPSVAQRPLSASSGGGHPATRTSRPGPGRVRRRKSPVLAQSESQFLDCKRPELRLSLTDRRSTVFIHSESAFETQSALRGPCTRSTALCRAVPEMMHRGMQRFAEHRAVPETMLRCGAGSSGKELSDWPLIITVNSNKS